MDENKGTPLIPDDMPPEMAPEDMVIPTRAELEERKAKEGKDSDKATDGSDETDKGGDNLQKAEPNKGDVSADVGKSDGDDGQGAEDAGDANAGEVYQTTLEDPGEYQPADYSFEVTVYDEDGKNGKQVKVSSVEQFEQLLDEEKNFGSAAALLKAQRLATKMESRAEADKAAWEKSKAEYNAQQEAVKVQNEALNQMAAELNYLVAKGKLPQVAKKYQNADWSDPEVAKQPGVKEQIELLNYMKKENLERRKAGLSDLTPSTALTEMRAEVAERTLKETADKAGEARRAAGARVAATAPAPVNVARKGVMVGRSFGDLSKLSDMQL